MVIEIGRLGAWIGSNIQFPLTPARAQSIEEMGYDALWTGGANGNLKLQEELIAATDRLVVATGIVNIWQYSAANVATAYAQVSSRFPDRLLLGVGAGHALATPEYRRPIAKLESYLDELDAAPTPVPADARVIAALGERALHVAAARTRGAHPFLVPPEHTADARRQLGAGPLLAPEQKVVLSANPTEARRNARDVLGIYLQLPNYTNNLKRYGLTDEDLSGTGSDRFIDAVVAWGTDEQIRARLVAHLDAGADHVSVHILGALNDPTATESGLRRVADLMR